MPPTVERTWFNSTKANFMTHATRGADLLAKALSIAGVQRLFSLSGNQIMPVYDACLDEKIELIHVRHEAAAVHMADAWGRLTGEPGVALVTAGPGHANALSALFVALAAESPLVMLSGHSPLSLAGKGAFQEMAQAEMAGHVAKASWTATDAANLGRDLARAMRIAKSGRPGPVHISLPADVLEATVADTANSLPTVDDFHPTTSLLDVPSAQAILSALDNAAKPLVLAGSAVMRTAGELLAQLEETTHVPVIGMESPRGINDPSLGAFAEVLAEADLILLVGKRIDFTLRFGAEPVIRADCRFMQIDAETRILEQTARVLDNPDRLLSTELADGTPALERLIQCAAEKEWRTNEWCSEVRAAVDFRPPEWETLASDANGRLHAVELCRGIGTALSDDPNSVFISDGGEFGQWAQACLSAPNRIINGTSGSIGSVLPFALAARVAFPDSRIVATLGDGTFGFQPAEFDTAVRYNLPFVAVVGNDACWNAEYQIQLRSFGPERTHACELLPTRYDEVVKALGGYGELVTKPSELQPALERAFASNLPACVNVALERNAAPVIRRKG